MADVVNLDLGPKTVNVKNVRRNDAWSYGAKFPVDITGWEIRGHLRPNVDSDEEIVLSTRSPTPPMAGSPSVRASPPSVGSTTWKSPRPLVCRARTWRASSRSRLT